MKDSCLILMVKCPRRGEIKKRLADSIGEAAAMEFYRCSGSDILETISGCDHDVKIGYHPPNEERCITSWLGSNTDLIPQIGNDLGERQASLLKKGFDLGYSKVCVMGSDLPDISLDRIDEAFGILDHSDCVIGPSPDGGYYLIGFSAGAFREELFTEMKWSHSEVVVEIEKRLDRFGIQWNEGALWQDVDDIDDLKDLIRRHLEGGGPKRTMEFLRGLDLP